MIRESIAVLIVGVLLGFAFLRTKHYGYLVASLPVVFIPVVHMLTRAVLYFSKNRFFGVRPQIVVAFGDLLGLVIACAFIAAVSVQIQSKKNRTLYLVVMLVYSVLLGWAYIFSSIQPLIG